MAIVDHHVGFVNALRKAGVPVSMVESIDTARALRQIDTLDRSTLKNAYMTTMIKRPGHRAIFDVLFDLWFPTGVTTSDVADGKDGGGKDAKDDSASLPPGAETQLQELRQQLFEMLLSGDRESLRELVQQIVQDHGRLRWAPSYSARTVLSNVSPMTMLGRLLAASDGTPSGSEGEGEGQGRGRGEGGEGEGQSGIGEVGRRQQFLERIREFEAAVATEVRRRNAELNGKEHTAKYADAPPPLDELDFWKVSAHDQAELEREVKRLARLFAARLRFRQRHRRRGRLDFRRTVRSSMATGGIPINIHHAPPRLVKPDLVIICDSSASMLAFQRFALMFIFAFREQFNRVRIFGFINTTDEITKFFEHGSSLNKAQEKIRAQATFSTGYSSTEYGRSFASFRERYADAITPRTSVIVLGDARSNNSDPGLSTIAWMKRKARKFYWLNPEPRSTWGTGDSEAHLISKHVEMVECRNIKQLGAFIDLIT